MSYVIRNCPCFVEGIAIKGNEQKTQTCNNHKVRELTHCKDCTDCLIKQVVDKCTNEISTSSRWSESRAFADELLQLFTIEEVK